ncbi:SPOSA6832_00992 [Sporobolomyces salmonicolor]|uniref:SPOSA6832_00992-mRNA-1:cds n=1 Tax=Sporidiobolus salmonicolor TaxID=5005 RepID=A0A0D6EIQ3_SPOSA|nr:SPOSA6832_00992 [Sporobolomyces salmonicolor]
MLLLSPASTLLRPATRAISASPGAAFTRPRLFSSTRPSRAAPALSADIDHYANLGIPRDASRKQIKEKFYELSRKYHPDAPSTSQDTPEQRTARFQALSQSYSVLSDPSSRKSYDLSLSTPGVPPHRRRPPHHPGYTPAAAGMGYAPGGYGSSATATANEERRRNRPHPSRRQAGPGAADAAGARRARSRRAGGGAADHLDRFAQRARVRHAQAAAAETRTTGGAHYRAGTAVFGAEKAEEESRLINDSSTLRSSQVVFLFGAVFVLAWLFSGGHDRHERQAGKSR